MEPVLLKSHIGGLVASHLFTDCPSLTQSSTANPRRSLKSLQAEMTPGLTNTNTDLMCSIPQNQYTDLLQLAEDVQTVPFSAYSTSMNFRTF